MTPPMLALTASALALALAGWVPRQLRPAPTILATVLVLASGAIAVSLEGYSWRFALVLLGAATAIGFAIGNRVPTTESGPGRGARWALALIVTAASIGLVWAGAGASAQAHPGFTVPAPSELAPLGKTLTR